LLADNRREVLDFTSTRKKSEQEKEQELERAKAKAKEPVSLPAELTFPELPPPKPTASLEPEGDLTRWLIPGLPDFSWYIIPKSKNIPNDLKIDQRP
jgi:hypothetical protein